jgi:hypothetical protein
MTKEANPIMSEQTKITPDEHSLAVPESNTISDQNKAQKQDLEALKITTEAPNSLETEKGFFSYALRLIDMERLIKEGATLKNVSDNMQSIAVSVAMFVAVVFIFKSPTLSNKFIAVIWGIWIVYYALLSILQSFILFIVAISDGLHLNLRKIYEQKTLFEGVIFFLFMLIATLFMVGTVGIIGASINSLLGSR